MLGKFMRNFMLAAALASCPAFADDFGDFGDFGGSGDGGFGGSDSSRLNISGSAEVSFRAYVDQRSDGEKPNERDKAGDWQMEANPCAALNFDYSGANSDISVKFKFDSNSLGDYKEDILDEFTARAYLGSLQAEAGKMKVVWGKGDKLHVLDNFNANDYTDYLIPDYIDRRIAEPMLRLSYATDSNVKIEGIYTPMMTPDRLGTGVWLPKASRELTEVVKGMVGTYAAGQLAAYNASLSPTPPDANAAALAFSNFAEASSFSADDMYADTRRLKYGQAGLRTTFTIGSLDLGLSYYYGHYKQPSADMAAIAVSGGDPEKLKGTLDYDQVQVFGLEAAVVLFSYLNTRAEFAYNLTKDTAGDDPAVHNNSIAWVAGFDFGLPISNLNINIQETGKFTFGKDKVEDSPYSGIDVDRVTDKHGNLLMTNNKLVVDITDTYDHENIKLDVKGVYGIERRDFLLMPSLSFKVKDGLTATASGLFIWCADEFSEFDGWQHNSFAQLSARYEF